MTDRYAELRVALGHLESLDHTGVISSWVSQAPAVRALLADYDEASARAFYETSVAQAAIEQAKTLEAERSRLRNAAQMLADWAEHEVGAEPDLTPGLAEVRAALAQEQGEGE